MGLVTQPTCNYDVIYCHHLKKLYQDYYVISSIVFFFFCVWSTSTIMIMFRIGTNNFVIMSVYSSFVQVYSQRWYCWFSVIKEIFRGSTKYWRQYSLLHCIQVLWAEESKVTIKPKISTRLTFFFIIIGLDLHRFNYYIWKVWDFFCTVSYGEM